ncbi:MAG: hypothetical protein IK062_09570 [Selenomonadaceae bacterium]|nr:hypothetical protein [Selenomonadaceae bacterium]
MGRTAKNLISALLIISALCAADFSSASDGEKNFSDYQELQFTEKNFTDMPANDNSEFWSKFRESVMPDDSQKNKIPNYEKSPPPPPDRNMPGPPMNE